MLGGANGFSGPAGLIVTKLENSLRYTQRRLPWRVHFCSPDDPQGHSRHFVVEERRTLSTRSFRGFFVPVSGVPAYEGSVWMSLFGVKASPLSLVGTRRRDRNNMARLLRVEALESKQLLAADVYVNDNWVEVTDVGGTPGTVENGDIVDQQRRRRRGAANWHVLATTPSPRFRTASTTSIPPAPFTSCSAATPKTSSSISRFIFRAPAKAK